MSDPNVGKTDDEKIISHASAAEAQLPTYRMCHPVAMFTKLDLVFDIVQHPQIIPCAKEGAHDVLIGSE